MVVLAVVPADEFGYQSARLLDACEALRKLGAVLEGFELRFRVGIVVGDVRTAVSFDDAQVRQKQRDRFARHRSHFQCIPNPLFPRRFHS